MKTDGTVRAWGRNHKGQLGDGTLVLRKSPVSVIGLTNATSIGVGRDHSLAARADGRASAWGLNDFGQLGDGTLVNRSSPVLIVGLTGATVLAGGIAYSLGL